MKTTSLAKAPMGSVAYVMEPNQMGYTELQNIPIGNITLQNLIDGMKKGIENLEKLAIISEETVVNQKYEFDSYREKTDKRIAELEEQVKALVLAEVEL